MEHWAEMKWRGSEMDVGELNTRVFLAMQINWINELSIKLGGFHILRFFWCRNICSSNALFWHHFFWLQHLFKNHIELPIVAQLSKTPNGVTLNLQSPLIL
jgi:hypothetical protein